jgi:hypothetical protein
MGWLHVAPSTLIVPALGIAARYAPPLRDACILFRGLPPLIIKRRTSATPNICQAGLPLMGRDKEIPFFDNMNQLLGLI